MTVQRVAGSFRDPSGFVFTRGDEVFRAIDNDGYQILQELSDNGRLIDLIDKQLIVDTQLLDGTNVDEDLRNEFPEADHFLAHERIPLITYPYEWTVSMLADAGIHTIDLQIELLESGCSLKDATAYNIQFVDGRPTFIDVASIKRPKRLDIWFGLGQFLQMFVYPLLLCRHRGWDLRSYFQSNLNGREIEQVAKAFGWWEKLRPQLLLDLTLPLWLHRWSERRSQVNREALEKVTKNSQPQIINLKRIRRKLEKLAAGYKTSGVWSDYTQICNYDDEAEQAKKSLVSQFLTETQPRTVLDLGCNTGDYSFLAADHGCQVTSVDADHDAVELLYRQLRDKPAPITPLVIDAANPSPAIGYMNSERPSFIDRVDADCVFALALMHHLLVSANMSLPAIRDFLHSLTNRYLIFEFVPTHDDMFERLMKYRVDLFKDVDLNRCKNVLQTIHTDKRKTNRWLQTNTVATRKK